MDNNKAKESMSISPHDPDFFLVREIDILDDEETRYFLLVHGWILWGMFGIIGLVVIILGRY